MPSKATNNVKTFSKKVGQASERALTAIAAVVISRAKYYVPIDTAALINSDFRQVTTEPTGLRLTIGFVQDYALALHERLDWQPRLPGVGGKPATSGYNPNARPKFLQLGVEESEQDIRKIIKSEYQL